MIHRFFTASFFAAAIVFASQTGSAQDYVWARSQFTAGPNRPVGVMGNGYGGYYVPRNAYGNNYQGSRITNPTGFIVPSQTAQTTQVRQWGRRR